MGRMMIMREGVARVSFIGHSGHHCIGQKVHGVCVSPARAMRLRGLSRYITVWVVRVFSWW